MQSRFLFDLFLVKMLSHYTQDLQRAIRRMVEGAPENSILSKAVLCPFYNWEGSAVVCLWLPPVHHDSSVTARIRPWACEQRGSFCVCSIPLTSCPTLCELLYLFASQLTLHVCLEGFVWGLNEIIYVNHSTGRQTPHGSNWMVPIPFQKFWELLQHPGNLGDSRQT